MKSASEPLKKFGINEFCISEFCTGGQRHCVARRWGPERIETGWWRTGLVRRDYYRIETTTGSRFWIFHELDTGQWYLQGEFS